MSKSNYIDKSIYRASVHEFTNTTASTIVTLQGSGYQTPYIPNLLSTELHVNGTDISTNCSTGSLLVDGGIATQGAIYSNNSANIIYPSPTQFNANVTQVGSKYVVSSDPILNEVGYASCNGLVQGKNTIIVSGPGTNNGSGACWVYVQSGSTYTNTQELIGSDTSGSNSQFGYSMALCGNTLAIGGPYDNSNTGAVWIFVNNDPTVGFVETQVIKGVYNTNFNFGTSVSLYNNTLVIGEPNNNSSVGITWVYNYSTTSNSFVLQQSLVGTGATGAAGQGTSVSIYDTTIVIGGPYDNTDIGAVWVFSNYNDPTTFTQSVKIVGTGIIGQGYFGNVVVVGSSIMAVGAPYDNSGIGATFTFSPYSSDWTSYTQVQKLVGTGYVGQPQQGTTLALNNSPTGSSNILVIGGPFDNTDVGKVWIFANYPNNGAIATEIGHIIGTGYTGSYPEQGQGISIDDGKTIVVGGYADGSNNNGAFWIFDSESVFNVLDYTLVMNGYDNYIMGNLTVGGSVITAGTSTSFSNITVDNLYVLDLASINTLETNQVISNITTTVSTGQTISLSATSDTYQLVTGSDNVYFILPDATTMTNGQKFTFNNNSALNCTTSYHDNSFLYRLKYGCLSELHLLDNSTTNGTWDAHSLIPSNVVWGSNGINSVVITNGSVNNLITTSGSIGVLNVSGLATIQNASVTDLVVSSVTVDNFLNIDGPTQVNNNLFNFSVNDTLISQSTNTIYTELSKLTSASSEYSICCVSSNGLVLVIGAPTDSGSNGKVNILRSSGVGQVYSIVQTINGSSGSLFGNSVSVNNDGSTIAIGAPGISNGTTYIYYTSTPLSGTWSIQGTLVGTGSTGGASGQGLAVDLSYEGSTVVIGGPTDGSTGNIGAAWVFKRSGSTWTQYGSKIIGTGLIGTGNEFGSSVTTSSSSITYPIIIIGAYGDNSSAGSIFTFIDNGTSYVQQEHKSGTGSFGVSVQVSYDGSFLVIGAQNANTVWITSKLSNSQTYNSSYTSLTASGSSKLGTTVCLDRINYKTIFSGDSFANSGVGRAFNWVATQTDPISLSGWVQTVTINPSGAIGNSSFGSNISLSEDQTLVVGAILDNSSAGAVWVYTGYGTLNMLGNIHMYNDLTVDGTLTFPGFTDLTVTTATVGTLLCTDATISSLAISNVTASTNPTTGSLVLYGGLGVVGALNVGSFLNIGGAISSTMDHMSIFQGLSGQTVYNNSPSPMFWSNGGSGGQATSSSGSSISYNNGSGQFVLNNNGVYLINYSISLPSEPYTAINTYILDSNSKMYGGVYLDYSIVSGSAPVGFNGSAIMIVPFVSNSFVVYVLQKNTSSSNTFTSVIGNDSITVVKIA